MSPRDMLRANDIRFAVVASELTPDEWSAPSLCTEWHNHEVLAHLVVGCSQPIGDLLRILTKYRDFDRANTALARRAGGRSVAELLDQFRMFSAQPAGLGRHFPSRLLLGDHVTHELDILYAVGREPDIPSPVLDAVLRAQVAFANPFVPAYRNAKGLRLEATDTGWHHGTSGPAVTGCAAELISVLGNRPKMLSRLTGDGVERLANRVLGHPARRAG